MPLSYEEATSMVTGPGQVFEVGDLALGGVDYRAFLNAPSSLRDLFGLTRAHGDATFLVHEDERWSFRELMARADALGAALVGRFGIRPGDRVAIGMRNYPEWVAAFVAILSIGAVSVSLNAWGTDDELDYALVDSGATLLVADRPRAELAAASCARRGVPVVVARAAPGATLPAGAERWEDAVEAGAALPDVAIGPDDDAIILYTSGTTGRPKGAVSTHRAVAQALFGFACRSSIEARRVLGEGPPLPAPAGVYILIVPLFHATGCVPVMMSCLVFGMKLVIMRRWEPERVLELIERERVTGFVGVPTQSWDLLASPAFDRYDTSSLTRVGGGGAPAPPELVRRLHQRIPSGGPTIGYGMTETNAYGPGHSGNDYLTHPTSTGRATPILQVAVRDVSGRPAPTGVSGEIWLKGPNLFRGYWGNETATKEALVDGWLRTGDLGYVDGDGFLYIEDRLTDMILRAGDNVYGAEVEAALYEHPSVHEAAVFGVPEPRLGEEVMAAVVARPGAEVTVAELQDHVATRLAHYKVPSRIVILSSPLPRNPAGKILKRRLREQYG